LKYAFRLPTLRYVRTMRLKHGLLPGMK